MSPAERRDRSARIEDRLFTLPEFRTASVVMFFASFQSEVETHDMIRRAIREGKRVVLPKVRGKELEIVEIGDYDADVRPGAWGIPEPDTGAPVALKDIGLIIVPGAAFDERGNRIGYGAGFYDRLLPAYDGPTVALSFDAQIVPAVPADPHDVPVKRIVTETRTIEAGPKF
jgi:5-formyltetrahydrofolate cyclo-ligase